MQVKDRVIEMLTQTVVYGTIAQALAVVGGEKVEL